MAQTYTDRLELAKDDGDESVLSWRGHNNSNLDLIDDFAEDISDSVADFETNPASSNHAAGTYFMLENTLHRAKSAIASGESITSNNAEPITIAQVLNTLNGNVSALQDSVARYNTEIRDNNRLLFQARPDEHNTISFVYYKDSGRLTAALKVDDVWLSEIVLAS